MKLLTTGGTAAGLLFGDGDPLDARLWTLELHAG